MIQEPDRKRLPILAIIFVLLVGSAVGYAVLARRFQAAHSATTQTDPGLASINGHSITPLDFYTALRAQHGPQTMNHLLERAAILQEADREKVELTPSETVADQAQLEKQYKDPEVRNYFETEMRMHRVLQKLLVRAETDSQKHRFYQTFKPALIQYEVHAITVKGSGPAHVIESALQRGAALRDLSDDVMRQVAAKTSTGSVTQPDLARIIGEVPAAAVTRLRPGQSLHLTRGDKTIFIQMDTIQDDYDALKPRIENILAEAHRVAFLYDLMDKARIVSPYDRPTVSMEPVKPLPGNAFVKDTAPALPGNAAVKGTLPSLPGNKTVRYLPPPLPGNPAVTESVQPLRGNKAVR